MYIHRGRWCAYCDDCDYQLIMPLSIGDVIDDMANEYSPALDTFCSLDYPNK